ncbi:monovalent cation:proton antiporter-2 (CPA2) family protein [Marinovum sp. SP66]|jgi:CPA2 family monovalent cation:H+ antiporter-2|uniref:monovalent cation:proton antiporter-2 (CPA2) family protein n=1 Tax=Marinovum TaxID=367771 RepID=UPI00237ADE12|nr:MULTISPECIES: monovalent cation:proton antiporter-2 (CPA2) family protein [unclassified Marinovum]MDD9738786.1 monovalent cation:proton antiporter-2 (CPA2) family protein [Marinovum sp. SP66]MDD9743369.1 monovalent cation:proton antiporter-2 (CPA2) family protein [Marinovum sp. PR37]
MESFLLQASIFLAAAVIAVPLAARLGLGSVLGYLAAGILIGPVFGFVGGHETQELQHFAEFGVVMMLFLIGLELEPRTLWDMRHKLIGLGGLQIGLSTVLIMTGAMVLGLVWQVALAVGLIFALSSTAIVLQTLSEKGLMQTGGGRSTFAVLLTQDIAVIPMLALLPLLAVMPSAVIAPDGAISLPAKEAEDAAHAGMSLVEGLPGWGVTLVTLGAVAAVILAGIYLVRPLFQFVHTARLRELNTALALLIVVGIGTLMNMVGLSPALGTFLAGVVLANSEFRHELESDIEPFKGLLLGLFFITVGAGIDFATFFGAPFKILGLTLAVIAAKGAVLLCLAMIFGLRGRNRWLFTLGLAQAGEFGFVLISFSVTQNILPPGLSQTLLLVVALSMLITPLLFILYELLSRRMSERGEAFEPDEIDEQGPVIIAGIGRFGQIVNRLVQSSGFKTVVLDHNMKTIELMRRFGFKGFYGDPTRPELLHAAGLREARVLVVALDDPAATLRLVSFARRERDDLHIVARAHDRTHAFKLYQAGANDIVREMFDSSLRAGRYVLENIGLTEYEAAEAERVFYQHDRHSVQELAKLWRDDIPSVDNEPYIARAKELERDLEALLLAQLQKDDAA